MNFSELGRVIELLGKDRGIERSVVVKAIEQAFLVTARKKFGIQGEYETRYNEGDDDIEIYQYKNVVEKVRDPILEIGHTDARELDGSVELGDQIGIKIENPNFSRVDVQTARQIIFQKVRDAEREILFAEYKHKEGQMVTGIARRYEKGNIIVDMGKSDAILPKREIIPGENFKPGDRITAYLTEVVMTNRGPEIRLSRTSPMFLVRLFEVEVPEIVDGTIEIKSAAREPGFRAKMAVATPERDIDPVGACVGMKGSRVQNVVNELQGEKIDIVRWNEDPAAFAKAALAPAEITSIMVDRKRQAMDVVVDEDQLSLAIGRRGQNVRLAAMLTGFKINIISKVKLQERIKKSVENLIQIKGLTEAKSQVLVQRGVSSVIELLNLAEDDLISMLGIGRTEAQTLLAEARGATERGEVKDLEVNEEEMVSASAVPAYTGLIEQHRENKVAGADKFSEAERRLREELAAFKLK